MIWFFILVALAVAVGIVIAPFLGWIALVLVLLGGGIFLLIWLDDVSDAVTARIPRFIKTGVAYLFTFLGFAFYFGLVTTIAFGVIGFFFLYIPIVLLGVEIPWYIRWSFFVIPALLGGWVVFGGWSDEGGN